jgi:dTDP-4-amino-4,6-dideoxygalactose transaminase
MALAGTAARRRTRAGRLRDFLNPRCVGPIGGTTTLADCLVALRYLLSPRDLIHGPAIAEYEATFARTVGARFACSFWAGRVGLYALLLGLGVERDDEVLLQVPTHVVVANAIRYTGARPVYVDCRLDSYNMDLEQAERRVTSKSRILLLQHTFGNPADLDAALALAARHNLQVIEDCVHALGATYRGRAVGSFGRAAFFSTEETKTISSTMGGIVTTDDPDLADRVMAFQRQCAAPAASQTIRYLLKFIAYHLLTRPYVHRFTRALYDLAGRRHPLPRATTQGELRGARPANYEQLLSNAQAAVALRQLRRLQGNIEHRRRVAAAYGAQLAQRGYRVPRTPEGAEPAFVRYPIWVDDRPLAIRSAGPRVLLGNWFTSVLEEAISPEHGAYEAGSCPRAEAAAQHLVNLPTHPLIDEADIGAIVSRLAGLEQTRENEAIRD